VAGWYSLLVFDVVWHQGADLSDMNLCDRRARLEALLERHDPAYSSSLKVPRLRKRTTG
jgi:ATP-dependent DNA ligase